MHFRTDKAGLNGIVWRKVNDFEKKDGIEKGLCNNTVGSRKKEMHHEWKKPLMN